MAYLWTMRRTPRRLASELWIASGTVVLLALTGCSGVVESPTKVQMAPDVFKLNLDTSKVAIVIEVHKDWAPVGVDHLYTLVKTGYYDGNRFFRVTHSYVQFGINGDPAMNALWSTAYLPGLGHLADAVEQLVRDIRDL